MENYTSKWDVKESDYKPKPVQQKPEPKLQEIDNDKILNDELDEKMKRVKKIMSEIKNMKDANEIDLKMIEVEKIMQEVKEVKAKRQKERVKAVVSSQQNDVLELF